MPKSTAQTTEGLIRILSSEALPVYPSLRGKNWEVELEKWIRDLYIYLRREHGKFTAENILNTIFNGGNSGGLAKIVHKSYHYSGTNDPAPILDNTYDWRRSPGLFVQITSSTVSAADVIANPDRYYCDVTAFGGIAPGYPSTVFVYSDPTGTQNLEILANGNLKAHLNGSGIHAEFWVDFIVIAFGGMETDASKYVSSGNGL